MYSGQLPPLDKNQYTAKGDRTTEEFQRRYPKPGKNDTDAIITEFQLKF